jgi:hypothetical protein
MMIKKDLFKERVKSINITVEILCTAMALFLAFLIGYYVFRHIELPMIQECIRIYGNCTLIN